MSVCRISFTDLISADDSTFQIGRFCFLQHRKHMRNLHVCETDDEVEDCLYGIMEKYDSLDCFHVFTEDLCSIERFLFFLRDQNPRKEIGVYVFGDRPGSPSPEPVFDAVNFLKYLDIPSNPRSSGVCTEASRSVDNHQATQEPDHKCYLHRG